MRGQHSIGQLTADAPKREADLDQLTVNTVRALTTDAVREANSGHPGMPTGIAEAAHVLWRRFLSTSRLAPAGSTGSVFSWGVCRRDPRWEGVWA
jgi:hypothetical protein